MKTTLTPIKFPSIYKDKSGALLNLPERMAKCTPDTHLALTNIASEVKKKGGKLILSDLFRSYDMQTQSHNDYVSGKKKAFSPPAGGSFHEAGRAFDIDLGALKMPLKAFWEIAAKHHVVPIIPKPSASLSEAWHFDCRGSHQLVYTYYSEGKGTNVKPYTAAAASAILAIGVHVDAFGQHQQEATLQSYLIRLGKVIGNIDGQLGPKSLQALTELNIAIDLKKIENALAQLEALLQQKYPHEFIA